MQLTSATVFHTVRTPQQAGTDGGTVNPIPYVFPLVGGFIALLQAAHEV